MHKFCEKKGTLKKARQEGHKIYFKKTFTHSYNESFESGTIPNRF